MATFLKKLYQKSRSESKSPPKYTNGNEDFKHRVNDLYNFHEKYYNDADTREEPDRTRDREKDRHGKHVRRTQSSNYCEPADEYFHISPNILSTPQPQKKNNNGVRMTPVMGKRATSKNSSRLQLNGGYGHYNQESNEYLNNTWNTNSNPYNEINFGDYQQRHRSLSPKKSTREDSKSRKDDYKPPRDGYRTADSADVEGKKPKKHRKKSIQNTYDYLNPQCKIENCFATIIIDDSRFLVCKHQLSHASTFFRTLFIDQRAFPVAGVEQISLNEYTVVVSNLRYPPSWTQFQWFIESTIPCPVMKDITEETLETCMRLAKRFQSKGLEVRCQKFICDNVDMKPPVMALCWLNWVLKHRFEKKCLESCMPTVARLSLQELESHRQMITEKIMADLMAMKLRTCYQQASIAFQTIHKMDHFQVDVEKCPRCNRIREQGRVRLYANPCQKLIGCERCLNNHDTCELGKRLKGTDYQAFFQCEHGLWPFNDRTEDCHCQIGLYKSQLHASRTRVASNFDVQRDSSPDRSLANGERRSPSKFSVNNTSS